jgi:TolB-like protein
VNIAARLEPLAQTGGIVISDKVEAEARGKVKAGLEDLGERHLRNIDRPVRVHAVRLDMELLPRKPKLTLPDRPSIAVLPFQNMSGDPEQDYFADGIVEDIITALSRFNALFVIARNSSFTYKGRSVDVKQVGRELGVRYVLEGSVRKAGSKLRITGQLIDAASGAHLWAERFDGGLEDIFDLQDQVTASVVGAIAPKLEQAEIERSRRKPTESLDAYDYYLRGMAAVHRWTKADNAEALAMFTRAIESDPGFAAAYGMSARCYSQSKVSGWVVDRNAEIAETRRLARRAAELGKDDAIALSTAGMGLAYVAGDLDDGAALIDRAVGLNPNFAWGWLFSGWTRVWIGEPETTIDHVARAMRLSPHDPQISNMYTCLATAHFFAGRPAEALQWTEQAALGLSNHLMTICIGAASAAFLGRVEEMHKAMARLKEVEPGFRVSRISELAPFRRREDFARLAEGLRKAGLPE